MSEKVVGILGGMGPEATNEMFAQIIRRTKAANDREHLRVVIYNNPKVPDRMAAIFGTGKSCIPELVRGTRALERAGADFIIIPCVTVHHFHGELQKRTRLPILHIVEETMKRIRAKHRGVRRMGLLATTGTVESGLFQDPLLGSRTELLVPSEETLKNVVMKALKIIKAQGPTPEAREMILGAANELVQCGAQVVIAGCTELPLVLKDGDLPVPIVDPIAVLAEAAIGRAGGKLRKAGRSTAS